MNRPLLHIAPQPFLEEDISSAKDPVDFVIDILERRRQGVVAMDAPAAAVIVPAFMDAMCGGPVRYGPPAPRRVYDWSVSKEENQRRAMAEIDAAFGVIS